jgi:hypothetical protein
MASGRVDPLLAVLVGLIHGGILGIAPATRALLASTSTAVRAPRRLDPCRLPRDRLRGRLSTVELVEKPVTGPKERREETGVARVLFQQVEWRGEIG